MWVHPVVDICMYRLRDFLKIQTGKCFGGGGYSELPRIKYSAPDLYTANKNMRQQVKCRLHRAKGSRRTDRHTKRIIETGSLFKNLKYPCIYIYSFLFQQYINQSFIYVKVLCYRLMILKSCMAI